MQFTQVILMCALLAIALRHTPVSAKCNTCGANGIACVSENSFNICYKGNPDASAVYTCPDDYVCVSDSGKCATKASAVADCAAAQNTCGVCSGNKLFTCLSSTTFAQCNGKALLRSVGGSCPSGLTCDSSRPEICVVGGAECAN